MTVQAQEDIESLLDLLGSPWAPAKQIPSNDSADFPITQDVSKAQYGIDNFWPRPALRDGVAYVIRQAGSSGFPSRLAPELYQLSTLSKVGIYTRVGGAGLRPANRIRYRGGVGITPSNDTSFDMLKVLIATDAAYENLRRSAGFLMFISPGQPSQSKLGASISVPSSAYALWGPARTVRRPSHHVYSRIKYLNTRNLQFINSTSALMPPVCGPSDSHSPDQMADAVHSGHFALGAMTYFRWMEPHSNWADESSKGGVK